MTAMPMNVALRSAMDVMLERDDDVVVFGEDVGFFGGVFRCTDGLQARYGAHRVFDTPIAEGGIIGVAVGMGAYGLRPVAEIQFGDYVYPGLDQLISEAARLRYRSSGEFSAPITVRMPVGGGIHGGQTHSQSPEALFTHVCGLKTVVAVEPLRRQGVADRRHRGRRPGDLPRAEAALQRSVRRPPRPTDRAVVGPPAGRRARRALPRAARRGDRAAAGEDLTVLAYGTMVYVAEAAVEETGVDAEIIDLRTLLPLDTDAIVRSVREDRPLRRDPRGDAHEWVRRRAGGDSCRSAASSTSRHPSSG